MKFELMARTGPIIIVEDDSDDEEVLVEILGELNVPNKVIWFTNTMEALDYLRTTSEQPFLILSDVNLPGQNGIEFKRSIDEDPELRKKSIPFVFYSTSVNQREVNIAYSEMTVQGFFQKGSSFETIKKDIRLIYDYWQNCRHPNYT